MEKCVVCNEKAPFKCTACKLVNYCGADHQKKVFFIDCRISYGVIVIFFSFLFLFKDWPMHKVNCRPFKIERSDEMGRYLVATRDIPAKSVIFIEPPLVIGPKWCISDEDKGSPHFPCVGCFKPTLINGNQCPK